MTKLSKYRYYFNYNITKSTKFISEIKKPKVFIFGCSNNGQVFFELIKNKCIVLGFVDNNSNIHGKIIKGKKVFRPDILKYSLCNACIIASTYEKDIISGLDKDLYPLVYSKRDIIRFLKINYFIKLILLTFTSYLSKRLI